MLDHESGEKFRSLGDQPFGGAPVNVKFDPPVNADLKLLFGNVPLMVNVDKRLALNDLRVFVALSSIKGNRYDFMASRKRIAERSGVHISHISKHTARLADLGI